MIGLQGQQSRIMTKDELVPVTRETKARVDGKYVVVASRSFDILANVQPVEGRELLLVPEADRFRENIWVFSQDPQPLLVNDRLTRNGVNYQVQDVAEWGAHRECRATRIDVGPNATP